MLEKIYESISCYSTIIKTIRRNCQGKKFESEVYVLDKFVKEGGVCFDIGAAYGRYAINFSRLVGKKGKVYCFEPGSYSFKVIKWAIAFHQLKNVVLFKKGLSDKKGIAEFIIPVKKGKSFGPSLAHIGTGGSCEQGKVEKIELTTVDDVFNEEGLSRLDFIKCDVEGAEMMMLNGARNTISRFSPAVLCEVDRAHLKKFGSSPEEIFKYFHELKYSIFILNNNEFKKADIFEGDHNYFFIPSKIEVAKAK